MNMYKVAVLYLVIGLAFIGVVVRMTQNDLDFVAYIGVALLALEVLRSMYKNDV